MIGRVKGDTLSRVWTTFRTRGHVERVTPDLPGELVRELNEGRIDVTAWYPVEHYLALYGALRAKLGHDEVIATAYESVLTALRLGSWVGFLAALGGSLLGEAFCHRASKRFGVVYKVTFEPGEVSVTPHEDGAAIEVSDTPWSHELAWRGGVTGALLTIPTLASLAGKCEVTDAGPEAARFELRWMKRAKH